MEGSWLLPSWPESGDNANRELTSLSLDSGTPCRNDENGAPIDLCIKVSGDHGNKKNEKLDVFIEFMDSC
jgi:hypothetical protein